MVFPREWPGLYRPLRFKGTIGDQFRMQPPEAFGYVAIPANGLMRREDVRQLLGTHVFPLRGLEIGPEQSGGVIHVMKLDRLAAEDAIFPFVPLRDDIPDQAILRIDLNLLEAILTAALALGPARAFDETESRLVEESADGGFASRNIDGCGAVRLRACDEPFPFEPGIGAQA